MATSIMIIGFVGFAGSGKDSCADYLVQSKGFVRETFAGPVKDCLAAVFGWPRAMLEGLTAESRAWRETIDHWWSRELGIPDFSPRWAMQHWATDVVRDHFHMDTWMLSMRRRLEEHHFAGRDVVVSDVRFPNEIEMLQSMGGKVVRVAGPTCPPWFYVAKNAADGSAMARNVMREEYTNVHYSEWAWLACLPIAQVIRNDSTLEALHEAVDAIERLNRY